MKPVFDHEYRTFDKAKWKDGPWKSEPDKAQWVDEETGLDCLIVRNPLGALCGYVGVPEGHSEHGSLAFESSEVHGGITFVGGCVEGPEDRAICHKAKSGRPDKVWWFGFDCCHMWDLCPGNEYLADLSGAKYRDLPFVIGQVRILAKELVVR